MRGLWLLNRTFATDNGTEMFGVWNFNEFDMKKLIASLCETINGLSGDEKPLFAVRLTAFCKAFSGMCANSWISMRWKVALALLAIGIPSVAQNKDHNFDVAKNLDVFNAIYKQLDMMYVDTLNADEVIGNGINAMLRSLDPYTVYFPAEQQKELKEIYTGKFAGIGALIRYYPKLKYTVIDEPYRGMPAAEAGLRKGDIILGIDDVSMAGKDSKFVSEHPLEPALSCESSVGLPARRCASRSRAALSSNPLCRIMGCERAASATSVCVSLPRVVPKRCAVR